MTEWDKQYLDLCKNILDEGLVVPNRTGTDAITIAPVTLTFDLDKEFPVLTTKQLYFRKAILEMMWIYQAMSNDVRWLHERDVYNIWDKWYIDEDGYWHATQNIYNEDTKELEKKDIKKYFGKEEAYTIGTAYGFIANRYQLIPSLIDTIRNNPSCRRQVKSLWQDEFLNTAVLPSCVWSSEWQVLGDKINLSVHQRSCDVPLGLPFNITQYATLANMVCHVTGYTPGKMQWSINDPHIYVNQIEGIEEQLNRRKLIEKGELESFKAPELWINPKITEFENFDNSKNHEDVKVRKYKHHGPIKFPLAQ